MLDLLLQDGVLAERSRSAFVIQSGLLKNCKQAPSLVDSEDSVWQEFCLKLAWVPGIGVEKTLDATRSPVWCRIQRGLLVVLV